VTAALWFFDHGIHVFPVHGKVPAVPEGTSQFDYRCTREQAARFTNYGVPLGLLAVADSDAPETEAWNAAHLIDTPFKVRTARGRHRYYRLVGDAPHFIHRDGHTIEFRHRGQYCIGPGSIHVTGAVYIADDWSWNIDDLPFFPVADFLWDDGSCGKFSATGTGEPYEIPEGAVSAGKRHYELFRFVRHCKSFADDKTQAREYVTWFNRERCRPPLPEDHAFERWFERAWNQRDRPFAPTRAPEIPYEPLEPDAPRAAVDLDAPGGDL
jgi:hypothetical protein